MKSTQNRHTSSQLQLLGLIALSVFVLILLSPKWTVPLAAWIAPGLVVFTLQHFKPGRAYLVGYTILLESSLVANFHVMPFPPLFFVLMVVVTSAHAVLPYWLNRLLWKRLPGIYKTFTLPTVFVLYDYLNSFGGGGTWGMLAYSQAEFLPLIQVTSLTGIWGLSFLLYWFAALMNWVYEEKGEWARIKKPMLIAGSIYVMVMVWGTLRIIPQLQGDVHPVVRTAAITANSLEVAKYFYEDEFKKEFNANINELTQTSPELQEVNKGLAAFIDHPNDPKFTRSHRKMAAFQDSLLNIASREARAGAKIILFSEALFFTTKQEEQNLLQKGVDLARENNIYLLLPMASFLPVKVELGAKFMENKALLIDPNGNVVETFFKNKPVPMVEGSVPGDGIVPVKKTHYGNVATSICYDADFPQLMLQAGKKHADILLLPSGDWREISPYHGNMARFRAVENGMSVVRSVSGAQSTAFDCYGRLISSRSFFDDGEKVMITHVPSRGVRTVYAMIGDSLIVICGLVLIALAVFSFISSRKNDNLIATLVTH